MLFFNRCSSKLLRSSAHDMSVAWDIFCLNPAGIGDRKVAKLGSCIQPVLLSSEV